MKIKKMFRSLSPVMSFAIVATLCISIFGVAYALNDLNPSVTNELKTPTVDVEIVEKFDQDNAYVSADSTTKEVQFKNTGTADAFIRVSYVEFWKTKDDFAYLSLISKAGEEIAVKNWTQDWTVEWVDGKDGWYYYKNVLKVGESTKQILTNVSFVLPEDNSYEGASYTLDFKVEALQASKDNEVNINASLKNFNKKAEIKDGEVNWYD